MRFSDFALSPPHPSLFLGPSPLGSTLIPAWVFISVSQLVELECIYAFQTCHFGFREKDDCHLQKLAEEAQLFFWGGEGLGA